MQVELRPIETVKPYPGNPRQNDAAVEAVAKSLREFGFRQPIVVDPEGVIIVGHTRWKAAQKLGLKQVPAHVATDLTPAQVKAYRLADNQTATLAEWNYGLLPLELKDLQGLDFDLSLLGFSAEDLGALLAPPGNEGLTDPDAVPAPPDEATTKPGDLWVIGNHRLLCGDSSKAEDVDRLLDGRAREDVLAHLTGFNAALDRRHDRRALTDEELARLIAAAESGPAVMGMAGPDRAMLYRVALGTGFRANELGNLTPESFDLDADPPTITVQAAYSKHRRKDVQPIRRDLANLLRPWLETKAAGQPIFTMPDRAAKMMQQDLTRAREKWVEEAKSPEARKQRDDSYFLVYRDSAGLVADFHALRHTYVSRLVRSGANVKVAQELARHSTPTLTLGRYAHMEVLDRAKALNALPAIEKEGPERQAVRATGTEDAVPCSTPDQERAAPGAARRTPGTPEPVLSGHNSDVGNGDQNRTQVA